MKIVKRCCRNGRSGLLLAPVIAVGLWSIPTPSVAETPAVAAPSADPSGQSMPVGNLPGWRQVFADNFASETLPLGSFSRCYGTHARCKGLPASVLWGAMGDGWHDTSRHCQYWPSKTVSVANGLMNIHIHTDHNGVCMVAMVAPQIPFGGPQADQTYGRYSVRFRSDAVLGYKGAYILWADDGHSGEIDFPEGNLDSVLKAFFHPISGSDINRVRFLTAATWTSWHTATIEWLPTRLTFILDGKTIGTTTSRIPTKPMHWTLRAESDMLGAPKPPPTSAGNMQIDWVCAWAYAP